MEPGTNNREAASEVGIFPTLNGDRLVPHLEALGGHGARAVVLRGAG